jgi:hypothetical protein
MAADTFTTEDIRRIIGQASECLAWGLIQHETCNKINRATNRVLRAMRKNLREPGSADSNAIASDIAELRAAERMLSGLLADGPSSSAIEAKVVAFPVRLRKAP